MKQPDIAAKDFLEIIHMIEASINSNLLEKGSVSKFLFKDSQDRWFFTYKTEGTIKIHYLKHGPWSHFEDVFKEQDKIYEGKDIMFPGANGSFNEVVKNFHVSCSRMSKSLNKNRFRECNRKETIWNMYNLPFETDSSRNLRGKVLKAVHKFSSTDMKNVEELLVTKGVLVSINYLARANKIRSAEGASPSPNKMRRFQGFGYSIATDDIMQANVLKNNESA
jgi:hypothetical protein